MKKAAFQFISSHQGFIIVLIAILVVVAIILAILNSLQRKRILALITTSKPGDIFETKDGDYILVSPNATLLDLRRNQEFKVYEILGRIWKDVGKKLSEFYTKPFEIYLKIFDLKKESEGYSIIVSDNIGNLYQLRTKFLPTDYIVKIQPYNSNEDKE